MSLHPSAEAGNTAVVWKEGESLCDVTHIIHEGVVQPLYYEIAPVGGAWPSFGKPFVYVVEEQEGTVNTERVAVTPAMLRVSPALRLPGDAEEVAALLAAGAVPGLKVVRVEQDEKDDSKYGDDRTFPAVLDGARKYCVVDGSLRPVYMEPAYYSRRHNSPASQRIYGIHGNRTKLDAPALAIYLEYEAPAQGEDTASGGDE